MGKIVDGTRIVIDRNSNGLHVGSSTGLLVKMFSQNVSRPLYNVRYLEETSRGKQNNIL